MVIKVHHITITPVLFEGPLQDRKDSNAGHIFANMSYRDAASDEGSTVDKTTMINSDKQGSEMLEHVPVTLTEEDVCCL